MNLPSQFKESNNSNQIKELREKVGFVKQVFNALILRIKYIGGE
jgi:hypothetical protein